MYNTFTINAKVPRLRGRMRKILAKLGVDCTLGVEDETIVTAEARDVIYTAE